ncbi:SIMPL domain-containing protein [Holospora undulata]|uniref:Oxidative stress defense protein n=1 Tax=Holospora undulata HU1 TaxID=1321371 RepID=A0A061JI14_9PROT|nr:SIMPL domain-containing protein [Holospora undulata]ETZ05108.1 hypothetical protein K737_300459 [Holospora undulata HU1]
MRWNVCKQALVLALCSFVALTFINLSDAIEKKIEEKTFTVHGVSEREVKSDFAEWKVTAKLVSDDIASSTEKLEAFKEKFLEFCKDQKIKKDECDKFEVIVKDNADVKDNEPPFKGNKDTRYSVSANIVIKSKDLDKLSEAQLKIGGHMPSFCITGSLHFYYTLPRFLRDKMVQEAFNDAQRLAKNIAKSACVKVEKVKDLFQEDFCVTQSDKSDLMKKVYVSSKVVFTIR